MTISIVEALLFTFVGFPIGLVLLMLVGNGIGDAVLKPRPQVRLSLIGTLGVILFLAYIISRS